MSDTSFLSRRYSLGKVLFVEVVSRGLLLLMVQILYVDLYKKRRKGKANECFCHSLAIDGVFILNVFLPKGAYIRRTRTKIKHSECKRAKSK